MRTYFFRVARGVLVDHLRRRYRKDFDPLTHSVMDLGAATPSRVFVELERTHALLACLRALPLETKLLLELYYWNGLTATELGEVFEVPEGTIRRRVFDVFTVARRVLHQHRYRALTLVELEEAADERRPTPEHVVDARRLLGERLTPSTLLVLLRYVEGRHGVELARDLDISEASVRRRVRRGLDELRRTANAAETPTTTPA